jgi:hypothetical protein
MYIYQSHLQFAEANPQTKKCKRACLSAATNFAGQKERKKERKKSRKPSHIWHIAFCPTNNLNNNKTILITNKMLI